MNKKINKLQEDRNFKTFMQHEMSPRKPMKKNTGETY